LMRNCRRALGKAARTITSSDRSWAGPGPGQIELGRDPTASERALGKVPQPASQLYRIWDLFPLNSDCDSEGLY
jgi:hypothetical protein